MANIVLDFLRGYSIGDRRESASKTYQYDQGHVVEIQVPSQVTTAELHYWIRGESEAGAYQPTSITAEDDGTYTILGNIPNTYFERHGDLEVYVVVTDNSASIVEYHGYIPIVNRQVPDDYVDTDPDNSAVSINSTAQTLYAQMQALVEEAVVCTDTDSDGNVVITLGGTS